MTLILQLAIFLLVLGIVVSIHELGHYYAGRMFGAAAESFSVGFGKPLFEVKDRRNTRWRINALPLGGFVKFVGESQLPGDSERVVDGPVGKPFTALTPLQRIIVALAGPFANFVLASLLFAVIFATFGRSVDAIRIAQVEEGTPAAAAGFVPGDIVQTVDGKPVKSANDFVVPIALGTGDDLEVIVQREGQPVSLTVIPVRGTSQNALGQDVKIGKIGVAFGTTQVDRIEYNFITALPAGVAETGRTLSMSVDMLGRLFTGREPISNLKGPVGIADTTRRAIDVNMQVEEAPMGARLNGAFWTLVQLTALISVGIGLVNLLPLPVLDGGHVVFNTYELLIGKPVPQKVQDMSLTFGLVMLFGVAAVVTWYDVIGTGMLGSAG